jgi:uncharacterized protein
MAIRFTEDGGWVTFAVKVVPGASRDRIVGEYDGGLKVTVATAPQNGAANRAVLDLLSRHLKLPRNDVEIVRGHSNPRKTVRVRGITVAQLIERLS